MKLLEFATQGRRFAVPLAQVGRVVPSALPSPIPGAPPSVSGALNIAGEIVALVDLAQRFGLTPTPLHPAQYFVVLEMPGCRVGFAVDELVGVTERAVARDALPPSCGSELVDGLALAEDGLCVLLDPERILLHEDRARLRRALEQSCHG